jgi:transcriptional regulator with XRE-family HTH domain
MIDARPNWLSIAPYLKAARVRKSLSAFEVCQRTGIQPSSLSAYENGTTEPKSTALLALCELYGIDPRELVAVA